MEMASPKNKSSYIASLGHNADHSHCRVQFHGGPIFEAMGVPRDVFEAFRDAESPGKYWHAHMKKYDWVRYEPR